MRILYLIYGAQSGVIRFLSETLKKRGAEVDVLNVAECIYPLKQGKIGIHSFSPKIFFNAALSISQFGSKWKRYIFRTSYAFEKMSEFASSYVKNRVDQYDLILQSGCLFGLTRLDPRIPYALYIDQTYQISKRYTPIPGLDRGVIANKDWENYEKLIYEKTSHIFTMSEYAKRSLVEDYSINEDKISVVGAGPNLPRIPTYTKKGYQNGKILFVGIDFIRKGGPQLLKAFEKVQETYPNAKLYAVGPKLEISERNVVVTGPVHHETMPTIYSDASLFVLPTLQEPFGLSFLEAMAYQLPCVGTDIEAVPEIIEDNATGFLVQPGNVDDLAEKITVLLSKPATMMAMGKRGHQKVLEKYNWDIVAEKILGRVTH